MCRNRRLWNTTEERIPQDRSPRSIAAIYTVKGERERWRWSERIAEIAEFLARDPRRFRSRGENRGVQRGSALWASLSFFGRFLCRLVLHRAIPRQPVGWSTNAAFDSFVLCPAIARERRNEEEVTIAKASFKRVPNSRLSLRNNDQFLYP